jgi:hypothetical protein
MLFHYETIMRFYYFFIEITSPVRLSWLQFFSEIEVRRQIACHVMQEAGTVPRRMKE